MAEFRQHVDAIRNRTIRISGLGTRTVVSSVWAADPATLTCGATVETDDTLTCLIGTATAPGEYEILALATLSNGEVVDKTFIIEVYE